MKHLSILCLLLIFSSFSVNAQTDSTHYDKALADSLKADDYGMRMYYFVILKTGTNTSDNKEETSAAFRGHLDNINKLVKEGKLIVAGPFGKNEKQYRGLFIFIAENKEEVEKLLSTDPAVDQSFLEAEIYDWYGSAALPTYLPYAEKISMKKP
ncbi:MAG: YciI family protein [Flavobacteriales bacterium]|nr:YciI family protein [Flavobacteriales bacterium]MCW8912339.1 YciI family protein [Flavobacteriales bacterium]MCW8938070.1 YciI family protein [Flavobacteriales bacterium]MCW8940248.1 YciI family protein [Flavobacteriales bacterium]MCW8969412.1 YciI family protein [Flavobacteriales bacterium]